MDNRTFDRDANAPMGVQSLLSAWHKCGDFCNWPIQAGQLFQEWRSCLSKLLCKSSAGQTTADAVQILSETVTRTVTYVTEDRMDLTASLRE